MQASRSSLYVSSQKSVRAKQHDKLMNMLNRSFEDLYHGGASASITVPFNWESEPGTPKVKSRDSEIPSTLHLHLPLPPLTPPPSYFYSTPKPPTIKNHSKSKPKLLINTILPKPSRTKTRVQVSPSASSSSSSRSSSPWPRSYSVPSSPMTTSNLYARNNELSRGRSLFCDSRAEEEEDEYESSVSTPCFGRRASTGSRGICSTMLKVLLIRDQ